MVGLRFSAFCILQSNKIMLQAKNINDLHLHQKYQMFCFHRYLIFQTSSFIIIGSYNIGQHHGKQADSHRYVLHGGQSAVNCIHFLPDFVLPKEQTFTSSAKRLK